MGPAVAVRMIWVGVTIVFVMFAKLRPGMYDVKLLIHNWFGKIDDPRMPYPTLSTRTRTSKSRV